jgi:hypothetical protein
MKLFASIMLKRATYILVLSLLPFSFFGQGVIDALRFNRTEISGTARYVGLSGAFGALGGDISALKKNPAGSAVFITNHAAFSTDISTVTNDVMFAGQPTKERDYRFDINQVGFVMVFETRNVKALANRLSFGLTYDRNNNFNNEMVAQGINQQSIDTYFIDRANSTPLDLLVPFSGETLDERYQFLGQTESFATQQAYLGFESFIFDAADPDDFENTLYESNVDASAFNQRYRLDERGFNSVLNLNFGAQIRKILNVGINLNLHVLNYDRVTRFNERNNGSGEINEIQFNNSLSTIGSGFSIQAGAIYTPVEMIRLGMSYQSPTWYNIEEETTQGLVTDSNEFGQASAITRIVNIFPAYNFKKPEKFTGSMAFIIGESGLISADYSYQDFSQTEFTSNGFADLNQNINATMQESIEMNLGGEYRFKEWSFRGGYHYFQSPIKNNAFVGVGDLDGFSAGLGYNVNKFTRVDLAYRRTYQDRSEELLQTDLNRQANFEQMTQNFVLTMSFNF